MAKDLSSYQQKIVGRYYDNRDTIMLDRLGQIVSDIYLSDSDKKTEKLWQSAATALEKVAANNAAARKVLADKNVEGLARLISELTVADKNKPATGNQSSSAGAASAPKALTPAPAVAPATSPAPAVPVNATTESPAVTPAEPTTEQLKMAMKAFRKRLKLTKLDAESRVGRSPLSGGAKSGIVAIEGPRDFPLAVWEALANEGKLKRSGRGFYELGPKA